jgi:phosphoserine aminotransferase
MGIMICSPAAIERAKSSGENQHYNSVVFMNAMMEKWQTPYTPNVLAIYLLMRVLEKVRPIKQTHIEIVRRYTNWITFLQKQSRIKHLILNKSTHSYTVLPVTASPEILSTIKIAMKKKGFLLGEGYGDLKSTTFRIANFPALKNSEITALKKELTKISS